MSEHNGSPKSPTKAVARSMVELAHDALTLAGLQGRLLKVEVQGWASGLITPAILMVVASCLFLGCVPVLLLSLAHLLVEAANLSLALSLLIAALVGLTLAGITALVGWRRLQHNRKLLEHSHEELARNITWFKEVLKHNANAPARNRRREDDATRYQHSDH